MSSPFTSSVTKVADGTSIVYGVRQGSSKQRVALVHSLAMDHSFWNATVDALDPSVSVVAIDARGHGASGRPAGPYTAALMAADLREVLSSLGWTRVLVGGASMGGCVALQFAIDNPSMVNALALMGTTASYGPDAPKDWSGRADKAKAEGLASLVGFQKTRWFSDAFRDNHPEVVQRAIDVFLRNDVNAYAATCNMLGSFNALGSLGAIRMPTAIIVGEEDFAAPPAMAKVMHEGIAGSTLQVVSAARHLLPLESPELVASTLSALLAQT